MHFLTVDQLDESLLKDIFKYSHIFENSQDFELTLRNKVVATVFYEPSTRTRLSFESAALRLGAQIVSTENAREMSSVVKGETLHDTLRVIEGYADIIVIRHNDAYEMMDVSQKITSPIINAGAGSGEHPTQALLDSYTIYKKYQRLDDLKVCVVGDLHFGRTIHSLVKLLSKFKNINIYGVSPESLQLPKEYVDCIRFNGATYTAYDSINDVPRDIDVLYCTRTQTERFKGDMKINEIIVNKSVLDTFGDLILMHPLPRNIEISTDVDDDPRSVYFQQAKNGMYVRMALLSIL